EAVAPGGGGLVAEAGDPADLVRDACQEVGTGVRFPLREIDIPLVVSFRRKGWNVYVFAAQRVSQAVAIEIGYAIAALQRLDLGEAISRRRPEGKHRHVLDF